MDAAAIDTHKAIAADHRLAIAGRVQAVAAVDKDMFRHFGKRMHRPRQRPQRCAEDIVAIDPRRRREGDRDQRGGADFLEQHFAALARQPLGIVEPFRNPLRIENHGRRHDRPGQRPAPASSQPATGQTPRFNSARSRRKVGGATAMTPLRGAAFAVLWNCCGFVPNHAGMLRASRRSHN